MAVSISRARIWNNTYHKLLSFGFSDEESRWAADRGFTLREDIMKRIIKARQGDIVSFMRIWNIDKEEAIKRLSRQNQLRNVYYGAVDDEEFDLLRILYP